MPWYRYKSLELGRASFLQTVVASWWLVVAPPHCLLLKVRESLWEVAGER